MWGTEGLPCSLGGLVTITDDARWIQQLAVSQPAQGARLLGSSGLPRFIQK